MVVTERHGEASVIINPVDDHVVSELLGTRNIWCRVHGFNPERRCVVVELIRQPCRSTVEREDLSCTALQDPGSAPSSTMPNSNGSNNP